MKKYIFETHNIKKLKIHHAHTLTEDITQRLAPNGLHAVIMCTDASQPLTKTSMKETLKHLDFDLISTALFVLNIVRPKPEIFSTVSDTIEKLSIIYNIHIVHVLLEVNIIKKCCKFKH